MQQKILSLVMLLNCVMIHADRHEGNLFYDPTTNISDLKDQKNQTKEEFRIKRHNYKEAKLRKCGDEYRLNYLQAFIAELCGENGAIDLLFDKNKKANEHKLAHKKLKKCNGSHTFGDPDAKSSAGKSYEEYQKTVGRENKLNQEYRDKALEFKTKFNDKVVPELVKKVIPELEKLIQVQRGIIDIIEFQVRTLEQCRKNDTCLINKQMTLEDISQKGLYIHFVEEAYTSVMQVIANENIPLTKEHLVTIAALHEKTKKTFESFTTISEEANKTIDILNKKSTETSIFETSNDHGDLAQQLGKEIEEDEKNDQSKQNIFSQ